MAVKVTNNAWGTLKAAITADATSFVLNSSQGERFPVLSSSGKDCFYCTLINASNELEIVKCTIRSKDTFTVERGQSGTTKKTFAAGCRVELRPVKELFESFVDKTDYESDKSTSDDRIEALEKKNSAPSASDISAFKTLYGIGGLGDANTWTGVQTFSKAPVFSAGFTSNGTGTFNANVLLNQKSSATNLASWALMGYMADTCAWRLQASAFAVTSGAVTTYAGNGQFEIATSGDGDEPIYVRQYSGNRNFSSSKRTLTLLDKDGNTSLPGTLAVSKGISTDLPVSGNVTVTGTITATGAISGSSLTASSDRRLKRDLVEVENASEIVDKVTCYKYKRLDQAGDFIGLIAQDVQEVLPEAVKEVEGSYLAVDPYALVSVLYQAFKELKTEVTELRGELAKKADKRSRAK